MCEHKNFIAKVDVTRLTKSEEPESPVTGYMADITVVCADCKMPFEFVGVPAGFSPNQPMISFDGTELRAPIQPNTDPAAQVQAIIDSNK